MAPVVASTPMVGRVDSFRIAAMDCPTEEALIRRALTPVDGILSLEFNLLQRTLLVRHTLVSINPVIAAITALGMTAEPVEPTSQPTQADSEPAKPWWPLALSGMAALGAETIEWLHLAPAWATMLLALVAVLSGGLGTYKKGWISLRHLNLNINALMSIAVTGALLIGQWPEAAMVMFLFGVAERIEAMSLDRARNAIRSLMQLAPDTATVQPARWRLAERGCQTGSD
jgi:Cd2+/Zn2+-exporting ATPase